MTRNQKAHDIAVIRKTLEPINQPHQDSQYYLNRELSLLQFNSRILELALDKRLPLLERLKFLFICCKNLDEFFEIRVAQLKEQIALNRLEPGIDDLPPDQSLKQISECVHDLVQKQYDVYNHFFLRELEEIGITILEPKAWTEAQTTWLRKYFKRKIQPILTPIGLDLSHPFPRLINKSLNFIVSLDGVDVFGRNSGLAIIQAPRVIPRILQLPQSICEGTQMVLLSQLLEKFIAGIFPGMIVKGCYQFRLTRNSDVFLAADGIEDLPRALQGELLSKRYGRAVRLEIDKACPHDIQQFLQKQFDLKSDEIYAIDGPINLAKLMPLYNVRGFKDHKFKPFTPHKPKHLTKYSKTFKAIDENDILMHHPYQSFRPVIDFVKQAAKDPDVLAIKQTLYRTGLESATVQSLIEAAKQGKEVTAVIELQARFDEADNIELANRLQAAGVLVVYGIFGFKTHAKMTLIVRKEADKLKKYAHLGTGNYHNKNAETYTDYSLLTADKDICNDVHKVFLQLTGMGKAFRLKRLIQSPFVLQTKLLEWINTEIEHASQGQDAHIIIKINALTCPKMIQALYKASCEGVKIELIVRGICCLRPGLPGISENIKVYSIVGRFLEHSRIYYFKNADKPRLYCASADWMERNFKHRIEVAYPILDPKLAEIVKQDGLLTYLSDNHFAWQLQADGQYKRLMPAHDGQLKSAQDIILNKFRDKI